MNKLTRTVIRSALIAFALISAAMLMLTVGSAPVLAANSSSRRLVLVSEPDNMNDLVTYNIGGEASPRESMVWVDGGRNGKALSLSGNGETLSVEYLQMRHRTMTFEGWFNWRGAAEGAEPETAHQQRLFTAYRNDNTWFSIMPHVFDREKELDDGSILNGIFASFHMETSNNNNRIMERWHPSSPDRTDCYALPQNEWHHVALVMDYFTIKLYIDGRLWFTDDLMLGVEEMYNNYFILGNGRTSWNGPTLNALVDDMSLFNFALTDEQIKVLYAGGDPALSDPGTPPPTDIVLPTVPIFTDPPTETTAVEPKGLAGGSWMIIAIIAVVGLFVIVTVLLNLPGSKKPGK